MNIQENILLELEKRGELNSLDLAKEWNVDHQLVVGGLKSLQSLGDVRVASTVSIHVSRWYLVTKYRKHSMN